MPFLPRFLSAAAPSGRVAATTSTTRTMEERGAASTAGRKKGRRGRPFNIIGRKLAAFSVSAAAALLPCHVGEPLESSVLLSTPRSPTPGARWRPSAALAGVEAVAAMRPRNLTGPPSDSEESEYHDAVDAIPRRVRFPPASAYRRHEAPPHEMWAARTVKDVPSFMFWAVGLFVSSQLCELGRQLELDATSGGLASGSSGRVDADGMHETAHSDCKSPVTFVAQQIVNGLIAALLVIADRHLQRLRYERRFKWLGPDMDAWRERYPAVPENSKYRHAHPEDDLREVHRDSKGNEVSEWRPISGWRGVMTTGWKTETRGFWPNGSRDNLAQIRPCVLCDLGPYECREFLVRVWRYAMAGVAGASAAPVFQNGALEFLSATCVLHGYFGYLTYLIASPGISHFVLGVFAALHLNNANEGVQVFWRSWFELMSTPFGVLATAVVPGLKIPEMPILSELPGGGAGEAVVVRADGAADHNPTAAAVVMIWCSLILSVAQTWVMFAAFAFRVFHSGYGKSEVVLKALCQLEGNHIFRKLVAFAAGFGWWLAGIPMMGRGAADISESAGSRAATSFGRFFLEHLYSALDLYHLPLLLVLPLVGAGLGEFPWTYTWAALEESSNPHEMENLREEQLDNAEPYAGWFDRWLFGHMPVAPKRRYPDVDTVKWKDECLFGGDGPFSCPLLVVVAGAQRPLDRGAEETRTTRQNVKVYTRTKSYELDPQYNRDQTWWGHKGEGAWGGGWGWYHAHRVKYDHGTWQIGVKSGVKISRWVFASSMTTLWVRWNGFHGDRRRQEAAVNSDRMYKLLPEGYERSSPDTWVMIERFCDWLIHKAIQWCNKSPPSSAGGRAASSGSTSNAAVAGLASPGGGSSTAAASSETPLLTTAADDNTAPTTSSTGDHGGGGSGGESTVVLASRDSSLGYLSVMITLGSATPMISLVTLLHRQVVSLTWV